jgi:hypothetical protein
MGFLLRIAPFVCGALAVPAFAQTAGHWEGTIPVPNQEVQIAVDLAKDDRGAWVGVFAQVTQNVRNIPLSDVKVDEKSVKFRLSVGANSPDFDCQVLSASAMQCTLTTPGGSLEASLKRTGDGKVDLPKASAAVSAALEGNWEGAVETPGGPIQLVAHFQNQPDKTVKATMDSPTQNAVGLALSDVVQKDLAVEFQLRVVDGKFKGTLNAAGTQLSGDWSQSGATMPLTMKKAPQK